MNFPSQVLASAGRTCTGGARPSAWELLCDRRCQAFLFARLLTDQVPFFFSFWLPEYLHRSRDFSLALIGLAAWIPYLAADVGGLSGGAVSDWLVRRGMSPRKARLRILQAAACVTPLAAVAVRTESAPFALACIALVLAAHSCWIVNLFTAMTETFPPDRVGAVAGYSGIGGSATAIAATLLTGEIVGAYGYVPIFTTLAVLHLTSYVLLRWLLRYR